MEPARVVVVSDTEAFFEQGSIKFKVDRYDLCKVLGAADSYREGSVLDRLTDASIISFAAMNDLPVDPYDRQLLRDPLHGVIQLAWCEAIDNNTSERLKMNQDLRVERYVKQLGELRRTLGRGRVPERVTRPPLKRTLKFATRYGIAMGADLKAVRGRANQIYSIIQNLGNPTFADILRECEGKVRTKTRLNRVVTYFINDGVKHGVVKVLNQQPKLK